MSGSPGIGTLSDLVRSRARAHPGNGFIWLDNGEGPETRLSYADLAKRVQAIGAGLARHGRKGDRVLILLPLGLDYTAALLAIASVGMIAVPVYPPDPSQNMLGLAQVKMILQDSTPAFGLAATPLAPLVKAAGALEPSIAALPWLHLDQIEQPAADAPAVPPQQVQPDDVAVLLYTSGSTGTPKGVMLTHANLAATAKALAEDSQATADTRICSWIPGYHVSGLFAGIVLPLWLGANMVSFSPKAFVERPRRWMEVISRYRIEYAGAPTFAYDACARAVPAAQVDGLDLSSWRTAIVGGEAIRPEAMDAFVARFGPAGFRREAIYTMFGQTESSMITTGGGHLAGTLPMAVDGERLRGGSAVAVDAATGGARLLLGSGRALPGMDFAIVEPQTLATQADGQVGEIWLGGPGIGVGYWGREEATRDTFQARTADGQGPYLRTGDLGYRAHGQVFVVGRMKEVIILRGLKFYPEDLEATVQRADPRLAGPGLSAFAFEGAGGEELLGIAVESAAAAQDPAVADDLASSVRRAIAAEWAVQANAVVFVAPGQLPRTRTGKIQRSQGGQLLASGQWKPVGGVLGAAPADGAASQPIPKLQGLAPDAYGAALPGALAAIIARRLGVPAQRIAPDRPIADFGIDSMLVVHIGLDISEHFGVQVPADELRGDRTVSALALSILSRRGKSAAAQGPAPVQNRGLRSLVLKATRAVTRVQLHHPECLPKQGPVIVAANHVNVLDTPLLADVMPDSWPLLVASSHLERMPGTDGLLRSLFRPIYVDLSLPVSFVAAIEALGRGEIVCIAPEGRLNTDGVLGEARPGAAFLAAMTGAPVVPLAVWGHVGWKTRVLGLRKLPVHIACGQPMRLRGTTEAELAANTDQLMLAIARMLPARSRGAYAARLAQQVTS